jgi:single-strand DNA-binding protein
MPFFNWELSVLNWVCVKFMVGRLNKVTLIGNVGRDPEVRSISESKEVVSLTIATSESWKDRVAGEKKERTEWHRVVIFNDALINVVKNYVKKGSKIYIEGSLQTRKWTDQEGQEKYTTEIILQNFNSSLIMLGGAKSSNQFNAMDNSAKPNNNFDHSELDDEIPW